MLIILADTSWRPFVFLLSLEGAYRLEIIKVGCCTEFRVVKMIVYESSSAIPKQQM